MDISTQQTNININDVIESVNLEFDCSYSANFFFSCKRNNCLKKSYLYEKVIKLTNIFYLKNRKNMTDDALLTVLLNVLLNIHLNVLLMDQELKSR